MELVVALGLVEVLPLGSVEALALEVALVALASLFVPLEASKRSPSTRVF